MIEVFYVNVAAGQSNNLDNLAGSLTTENWETAKKRDINGGARSIGRWYDYSSTRYPQKTFAVLL